MSREYNLVDRARELEEEVNRLLEAYKRERNARIEIQKKYEKRLGKISDVEKGLTNLLLRLKNAVKLIEHINDRKRII